MKKIMISILILSIMITSGCLGEKQIEGTYEVNYYGNNMLFNSNLEIAKDIKVMPNEQVLKETLIGYEVVGIQFAYYQNDTEAAYYMKGLMPFASKYTKLNKIIWNYDITEHYTYTVLNSTDDMPNATITEPAILLIGPAYTDETYIEVDNNIVKVYAADLTLRQGKYAQYTDYDLALDKIILVLMNQ